MDTGEGANVHGLPVVPNFVHDALNEVRISGVTNMLDFNGVVKACKLFGYRAAATWLLEHKADYFPTVLVQFGEWVAENDPH